MEKVFPCFNDIFFAPFCGFLMKIQVVSFSFNDQ